MDQINDIAEEIGGGTGRTSDALPQSEKAWLVTDTLGSEYPVTDDEIAAVEAFLGLQAAMILNDARNGKNADRNRAI